MKRKGPKVKRQVKNMITAKNETSDKMTGKPPFARSPKKTEPDDKPIQHQLPGARSTNKNMGSTKSKRNQRLFGTRI